VPVLPSCDLNGTSEVANKIFCMSVLPSLL
jgi:hypothetical protein